MRDRVALQREQHFERLADGGLVVDDQDAGQAAGRAESPLAAVADAGRFKGSSTSGMNGIPQQGKLKMEGCAGADGAFDMNLAGVLLDDAVGDGKSQAGAAAVAGLGAWSWW